MVWIRKRKIEAKSGKELKDNWLVNVVTGFITDVFGSGITYAIGTYVWTLLSFL